MIFVIAREVLGGLAESAWASLPRQVTVFTNYRRSTFKPADTMQKVYSHHDSTTVGLIDGILKESGIPTLLKNWTGSNIIEIPIPSLYPSIHVLDDSDAPEAKKIIEEYLNQDDRALPEWECPVCKSKVDGYLFECWSCQTEKSEQDES